MEVSATKEKRQTLPSPSSCSRFKTSGVLSELLKSYNFYLFSSLLIRRLSGETCRTEFPIQLDLGLKFLFIFMLKVKIHSFQIFPLIGFFIQ